MTTRRSRYKRGDVALVVCQDRSTRKRLSSALATDGIRVIEADSNSKALEMLVVHDLHVVAVDANLPDRSGTELAHIFKERRPDAPVILLTEDDALDKATDPRGPLDAYLLKPVEARLFRDTVTSALELWRLSTENRSLAQRLERVDAYQALYDHLTGLPNRALLDDRLEQALASCRRTGLSTGLLFIDLDNFKDVNDVFGHQIGDDLLRELARRLDDSCRDSDSVARFGGDEFVIVCPDVKSSADVCLIAAHLIDKLGEQMTISGVEHHVTASIGVAVTDAGGPLPNAETLLRDADTAMYRSKEAGGDGWELYDEAMRVRVMERFEIERGLRNALKDGGLYVEYQPLVDLRSGSLVGAEALLRWNRFGRGRLLPGSFLDVAEDLGLIVPIGEWVLKKTLSDMAEWRTRGMVSKNFRLWVNVSAQQVASAQFPGVVKRHLRSCGVAPECLGIEISEDAVLDVKAATKTLAALKTLGVSTNLDDFGGGRSDLWVLHQLPISGIKIDRRFVATLDAPGDERGSSAVSGLIKLGKSLDLAITAEGVETAAQDAALRALGCEFAQGYFYGHPGSAEQMWQMAAS